VPQIGLPDREADKTQARQEPDDVHAATVSSYGTDIPRRSAASRSAADRMADVLVRVLKDRHGSRLAIEIRSGAGGGQTARHPLRRIFRHLPDPVILGQSTYSERAVFLRRWCLATR
jgi:hypothetical protein